MTSRVMSRTSAAKRTAKIGGKRITAKQRVARVKNIAIARKSKKKGSSVRSKENIRIGFALTGAAMGKRTAGIRLNSALYDQGKFKAKHGRNSKMITKKIKKYSTEYKSHEAFIKKYKNRKTYD